MKTILLFFLLFSSILVGRAEQIKDENYSLQQVVMISNHGIIAPFVNDDEGGDPLISITPYPWEKWRTASDNLTFKGAKLEGLFGQYLDNWLSENGLIAVESCPNDEVLIYANSLPKTMDSAASFIIGAFPNCQMSVEHLETIGKMDSLFNPMIRRIVNDNLIERVYDAINIYDIPFKNTPKNNTKKTSVQLDEHLNMQLNKSLAGQYSILETILNYQHAPICVPQFKKPKQNQQDNQNNQEKKQKDCQLKNIQNHLFFMQNEPLKLQGGLSLAAQAIDRFILQFYEGYPDEQVAWGRIHFQETWQQLMVIKNTYNHLLFTNSVMAQETATPLLKFIQNSFFYHQYDHPLIKHAQNAKFVLLVGQDFNIASLLALLNIHPFSLPEQYESIPIGGKVVFQRWRNQKTGEEMVKIEYFYQSAEQLRQGKVLNKDNPPKRVILEMMDCPIDDNGFCPLERFDQAISKIFAA